MSLNKLNEIAKLTGFSKVLGAPSSNFVMFDRDTDGRNGRPIFIDGSLASKFNGMCENDLSHVFQKIKQLKSKAGSISSYSNMHNAMEHMTLIGRAKVKYKLLTATGDPQRRPGVYITDVDVADFSDGEAGVYKVERDANTWELIDKKRSSITSNFAAVNGLCRNIKQAGTQILPPMLESAYRESKSLLEAEGYDLFFNPPSLYDDNKEWITPTQKRVTKEITVKRLADAMKGASVRKQPVQWVIHGDGAKVLKQALTTIQGADLSNHTLMFMAPMEEVADILPLVRQSKMKLHQDVMQIHDHDGASKMAQMGSGGRLESELKRLGMGDRGEVLRNKLRKDGISAFAEAKGAVGFGLSIGAFLMAPSMPGITVGAAVGAALSAATAMDSAQAIRNRLSTSIKNPAFNPHLNPHKSVEDLNLSAKKASGSLAKTFVDVVKARVKG